MYRRTQRSDPIRSDPMTGMEWNAVINRHNNTIYRLTS